jgi:hypothetical protein
MLLDALIFGTLTGSLDTSGSCIDHGESDACECKSDDAEYDSSFPTYPTKRIVTLFGI